MLPPLVENHWCVGGFGLHPQWNICNGCVGSYGWNISQTNYEFLVHIVCCVCGIFMVKCLLLGAIPQVEAAKQNTHQTWAATVQNLSVVQPFAAKESKQLSMNAFLVARNQAAAVSGLGNSSMQEPQPQAQTWGNRIQPNVGQGIPQATSPPSSPCRRPSPAQNQSRQAWGQPTLGQGQGGQQWGNQQHGPPPRQGGQTWGQPMGQTQNQGGQQWGQPRGQVQNHGAQVNGGWLAGQPGQALANPGQAAQHTQQSQPAHTGQLFMQGGNCNPVQPWQPAMHTMQQATTIQQSYGSSAQQQPSPGQPMVQSWNGNQRIPSAEPVGSPGAPAAGRDYPPRCKCCSHLQVHGTWCGL